MTYSTTQPPAPPQPQQVVVKEPINLTGPCLVLLIILCVGKPDLLDAIIHYVMTR